MKKIVVPALLLFALQVIFLSGCGGKGQTQGAGEKAAPSKVQQLRIQAVQGGDKYFLVSGISKISTEKKAPVKVIVQPASGDIEQIRKIADKKAELGLVGGTGAMWAYEGTFSYKDDGPRKSLRGLFAGPTNVIQFVVRADSKLKSLNDVKDKTRIATFLAAAKLVTNTYLSFYNKKEGVDYVLQTLTLNEMLDQLKDNNIDMMVLFTSVPGTALQNLEATTPIRVLGVTKEIIEGASKKLGDPTAFPVTLKAGTYKGQTEDALCPALPFIFVTDASVDEQSIYEFCKLVLENTDELAKIHPTGKELSLENALRGVKIPLHPGAEKYLKEKGVIK